MGPELREVWVTCQQAEVHQQGFADQGDTLAQALGAGGCIP